MCKPPKGVREVWERRSVPLLTSRLALTTSPLRRQRTASFAPAGLVRGPSADEAARDALGGLVIKITLAKDQREESE